MKTAKLETKAVEYGSRETEFETRRIVKIEGDWFRMVEPYGSKGGRPDSSTKVESISETEAHRELLSMGAIEITPKE